MDPGQARLDLVGTGHGFIGRTDTGYAVYVRQGLRVLLANGGQSDHVFAIEHAFGIPVEISLCQKGSAFEFCSGVGFAAVWNVALHVFRR